MQPLRDALRSWQPASGTVDPIGAIQNVWPSIVGADVSRHSRPAELVRGALLVVTRSGAWSQQLSFLSEKIVDSLQREVPHCAVHRLRFRVGRVLRDDAAGSVERNGRHAASRPSPYSPSDAGSAEEAAERFRLAVIRTERAKARAGWKECEHCRARIAPGAGVRCGPCQLRRAEERGRRIAQLLYEAPWLGFYGVADLIEGLTRDEYEHARRALLRSWWDALARIRREGRTRATVRERLIASSYVLLKSGLDPERIASAVVRDLLGDELHATIFSSESS